MIEVGHSFNSYLPDEATTVITYFPIGLGMEDYKTIYLRYYAEPFIPPKWVGPPPVALAIPIIQTIDRDTVDYIKLHSYVAAKCIPLQYGDSFHDWSGSESTAVLFLLPEFNQDVRSDSCTAETHSWLEGN